MKKILAIDMGATSIRGILAYVDNNGLQMQEVMRLSHKMVKVDGCLRWQWSRLITAISDTIVKYASEISAVAVDTWGVDFGLIDTQGKLLVDPMTYREPKHLKGLEISHRYFTDEELFRLTGNQVSPINTLNQLLALRAEKPQLLKQAAKILLIPDLVQYYLCGAILGEKSIWSTTAMLDARNKNISEYLLDMFGLNRHLIPAFRAAGTVSGSTLNSIIPALRAYDIKVINVLGHDTAGAALVTRAMSEADCMFISCGTWSLVGVSTDKAFVDQAAYRAGLTNELAYQERTLLLQNITGLYVLEQYKQQLENKMARKIAFSEITEHVEKHQGTYLTIDLGNSVFAQADTDFAAAMKESLCHRAVNSGSDDYRQYDDFDYFGVIYQSLAEQYRQTQQQLRQITQNSLSKVHLIGGGAKSTYLCQLIADTLQTPVIAGPYEASALGNILLQLKALGEIKDIAQGLELSGKICPTVIYQPQMANRTENKKIN